MDYKQLKRKPLNLSNPKNYFLIGELSGEEPLFVYSREKKVVLDDVSEDEVTALVKAGTELFSDMDELLKKYPNKTKEQHAAEARPFNESRFNKWKQDHYHKNEVGYFTDVVVNFRVYYTEDDLLKEYNKEKTWCEDPNDEHGYKNFRFGFKYDLYF